MTTSPIITFPEIAFFRLTPDGHKQDLDCTIEAKALVVEAELMGISWEVVPYSTVVRFSYKNHVEYVRNGTASVNRAPGQYFCYDKYLTRAMLADKNLPIAKGFSVLRTDTLEDRTKIFDALQTPLVVKPVHGTHGAGVKMGITALDAMNQWIDTLLTTSEQDTVIHKGMVLVEETAIGTEYRIIATQERVVAVMSRRPASVIGDGIHTIAELITEKNKDPMRNIDQGLYPHITLDDDMREVLATQQLTQDSIPKADQHVTLRLVSNIMAGGDAVDVTDDIHPSVATIAVEACRAIQGMGLVGIDYMTTDITSEQVAGEHVIIEVNSAPEYTMHDYPMIGKKRGVAREILKMMFPEWTE